MAAIAAAKKEKRQKEKADDKNESVERYAEGQKVQYWSAAKSKWVDARVLRTQEELDGKVVYELTCKVGVTVTPDVMRPRPGTEAPAAAPKSTSGFVSFDAFDARQSMKRGRQDSDSGDERSKTLPRVSTNDTARSVTEASEPLVDWGDPPTALLPREDFGDARRFIEHFVQYAVGAWRRESERGFQACREKERAAFKESVADLEEAMAPLLQRLASGKPLERGEHESEIIRRTGSRTACDGRAVAEAGVVEQLDRMASCASEREYREAHAAYMKLTLGNKRWNLTHTSYVSANSGSGAREYRRNRDSLNTYDVDPVAQKYMQKMRKLVQFLQSINPNSDESKNVLT